ncbi:MULTISPECIES: hypothetical protein [unclassified Streptomyces]|uniref:hypothetical protein n=1 Tax=unclassified Streptomyces TaxID=2593676 RepID=UPI002254D718|nr:MULTISPECIES: hypothetical protein [unclassified Streptomyces]MCX4988572.1 hypothetical protein [Streptomyces sp. NBC_00568]MCX5006207.1 hypothetical protein [Streptomyces sp. NBC_00638]
MSDESLAERAIPATSLSAPAPAEPARGHRWWGVVAASAAAGLVIGSGAVALAWNLSGSGDGQAFTLVGQVQIGGSSGASGPCSGDQEFGDLDKGAPVTVFDSAGRVVATGSLGSGAYDAFARCAFPIAVRGVPGGSNSYTVQVGWHAKKRITNEEARTGSLVVKFGMA